MRVERGDHRIVVGTATTKDRAIAAGAGKAEPNIELARIEKLSDRETGRISQVDRSTGSNEMPRLTNVGGGWYLVEDFHPLAGNRQQRCRLIRQRDQLSRSSEGHTGERFGERNRFDKSRFRVDYQKLVAIGNDNVANTIGLWIHLDVSLIERRRKSEIDLGERIQTLPVNEGKLTRRTVDERRSVSMCGNREICPVLRDIEAGGDLTREGVHL